MGTSFLTTIILKLHVYAHETQNNWRFSSAFITQ